MTIAGPLMLLAALAALSRLQPSLITRAVPGYQPVVGVLVHALTASLVTLITWFVIVGFVVAAAALLSGLYSSLRA